MRCWIWQFVNRQIFSTKIYAVNWLDANVFTLNYIFRHAQRFCWNRSRNPETLDLRHLCPKRISGVSNTPPPSQKSCYAIFWDRPFDYNNYYKRVHWSWSHLSFWQGDQSSLRSKFHRVCSQVIRTSYFQYNDSSVRRVDFRTKQLHHRPYTLSDFWTNILRSKTMTQMTK